MSRQLQNRLRSAFEIQNRGEVVEIPCDRCAANNKLCVAMQNVARPRCSECVRSGKTCTNMTWSSLDKTRAEYRKKVKDGEAKLAEVIAALIRDKKILEHAEEKAARKNEHLLAEMEKNGELEVDEDESCPAASALVGLSPAIWATQDVVNNAVAGASSFPGGAQYFGRID